MQKDYNKKTLEEIIEDDIDDDYDEFYDYEVSEDNFNAFVDMLNHQKQKGYFYPDEDDDELLIEEDIFSDEEDYQEKLKKAYKSYRERVLETRRDENEE